MLHKLMLKIGLGALGGWLKKSPLYEPLKGKKRIIGGVLGGIAIAIAYAFHGQSAEMSAEILGAVAALFLSLGWVDANYRDSPFTGDAGWYIFLRDHWTWVTALATAATASLTQCEGATATVMSKLHMSCGVGIVVIGSIVAVLGWAVGAAKLAPPPLSEQDAA